MRTEFNGAGLKLFHLTYRSDIFLCLSFRTVFFGALREHEGARSRRLASALWEGPMPFGEWS
jgi:hypothetical protein